MTPHAEWNEYMQSWFLTPSVDEIVAGLEESYRVKGDASETAKMRADARSLAEQYDTDKIYASHWRPVLADLESRMKPAENRQQRRAKQK